jgi:DNA-binding HxlR family transcriptional regulator
VLDVLGGKWKILILWQLTDGALRYSQLRDRLDGVSDRMLAKQLRELEDDRLLARTAYAEVPPRVEYSLTDTGRSLTPHLNALAAWGAERLA